MTDAPMTELAARAFERRLILAFLREAYALYYSDPDAFSLHDQTTIAAVLDAVAARIEKGEHAKRVLVSI